MWVIEIEVIKIEVIEIKVITIKVIKIEVIVIEVIEIEVIKIEVIEIEVIEVEVIEVIKIKVIEMEGNISCPRLCLLCNSTGLSQTWFVIAAGNPILVLHYLDFGQEHHIPALSFIEISGTFEL